MQDAMHPFPHVPSSSGAQFSTGTLPFYIIYSPESNYVRDAVILEIIVTANMLFISFGILKLFTIDLFVCLCCRRRDAGTHLQAQ
jgi:hypothetical protein